MRFNAATVKHNDKVLDDLLAQAEAQVVQTLKGMTIAAFHYVLAQTPQWSGNMVAQWQVVKKGQKGKLNKHFKVTPWEDLIGDDERLAHASKPHIPAMLEATARVQKQVEALSNKDWLEGVSLINPHPAASEVMGPQQGITRNGERSRVRHPRGISVLDGAVAYVTARFAGYGTRAGALTALRAQHLQVQSVKGRKTTIGVLDRKRTKNNTVYARLQAQDKQNLKDQAYQRRYGKTQAQAAADRAAAKADYSRRVREVRAAIKAENARRTREDRKK